jgi:hypothetical protein
VVSYKELTVWSKAMDVATEIYAVTRLMPKQEEFRLTAHDPRRSVHARQHCGGACSRHTKRLCSFRKHRARLSGGVGDIALASHQGEFAFCRGGSAAYCRVDEVGRMLNRLHSRLKEAVAYQTANP